VITLAVYFAGASDFVTTLVAVFGCTMSVLERIEINARRLTLLSTYLCDYLETSHTQHLEALRVLARMRRVLRNTNG
jgi:hypothetical protein